ncbi:AvrD family protein [Luethyella okanaganae]|uniref:AvrD family protein n=1 Tax=Luethyella okanaganae TaxID=69372 RepID=A0ABW1VEQ2_9MICO
MVNYYATIDHALGSPKGRYFGQGHRRSIYSFTPDEQPRGRVAGTCTVTQDGLWSAKDTGVVSRHLSTIDAVSLAGLALQVTFRMEPVIVEKLFVTSISIKAGTASTEDLNAVPLEARIDWKPQDRAFACSVVVGTMKLALTVEAVVGRSPELVREDRPKFYAEHLQGRIQHISDINIDCDSGSMQARLGALVVGHDHSYRFSGFQSAHAELFSISEAIVCLAQLAQTMAYEYDQISRDDSATFWLRRLNIDLTRPRIKVGQLVDIDVKVSKTNEVAIGSQAWRTLRLTASGSGISAVADVAHILPSKDGDA